jgi:hypothetical protein
MSGWKLLDCAGPVTAAGDFPSIPIESAQQLRRELERFRQRSPSMVHLVSPQGETLAVGLGGEVAGLRWMKEPLANNFRMAIAREVVSPHGMEFRYQGTDNGFRPRNLLPADEAVEAAVFFFLHHRLPESVAWAEWDPATKRLEVRQGKSDPAPALPDVSAPEVKA